MKTFTYSAARSRFAASTETVCRGHLPAMMSLDDFESMEETAYLLKSPKNAKKLFDSSKSMQTGNVVKKI